MRMPILRPLPFPIGVGYLKTLFTYTRKWEIVEDYCISLPGPEVIFIPRGFVFDGASIPKMFRGLLSPVGILLVAAIVHDYAYRHHYIIASRGSSCLNQHYVSKYETDRLFLEIADYTNGQPWLNRIAYLAVRQYGIKAWSKMITTGGV